MSYELSNIINSIIFADCFDVLKQLPDKCVDLVLTDPPYGIGFDSFERTNRYSDGVTYKDKSKIGGNWDKVTPPPEFFAEIKRISKNQIVWGGNYFLEHLGNAKEFIFWYKHQPVNNFADGEFAWTSFKGVAKCFDYAYYGNINSEPVRFHPTQKPVPLFKWCLTNYSKPGDLILDPMCGSGTTALACHALGRRYICIDKESDYVEAARNRLLQFQAQGDLFAGENSALVEECQTNIQQELYAADSQEPLAGGTCSDEHVA